MKYEAFRDDGRFSLLSRVVRLVKIRQTFTLCDTSLWSMTQFLAPSDKSFSC